MLTSADFNCYATCAAALSLLSLVLAGMTAGVRAKHKGYMNPEDVKVSFGDARLVEGADHPEVARVQRAHRNLLETLPLFFALGLLCVLARVPPLGTEILCGVYTLARVVHAIVYIKAMQPWRTAAYALGALALIGMAILIVKQVLAG
jgi:uncharacterized MAPEG superfamily protein